MFKIKEYRLKSKLEQKEVAAKLGVTDGTISNWERGSRMPGFDQAVMLADIFHCSLDELAGRETPERTLTEFEQHMIDVYNNMNQDGQTAMEIMIDSLAANPANRKKYNQVQEGIS